MSDSMNVDNNEFNDDVVDVNKTETGLIAWFANNPVASNLLMGFIIIMGLVSYNSIQRQMFPNVEINFINVQASYPGAAPREIEESILIKIEESLKDPSLWKDEVGKQIPSTLHAKIAQLHTQIGHENWRESTIHHCVEAVRLARNESPACTWQRSSMRTVNKVAILCGLVEELQRAID